MSSSTGSIPGLADVGSFDSEDDTDWLILRLLVHSLAAAVLGLGLVLAMLQGFVRRYVLGGSPGTGPD